MSIDYGIYAGPYARCKVSLVEVTKLQISCPNAQCKNHARGLRTMYCDLCGSKVASVPHKEMDEAVDHWDVSEAINERLATAHGDQYHGRWLQENRTHLWMPNNPLELEAGHLNAREAFALFTIEPQTIADEMARFQSAFQDDLDYLRTVYGADAVTIHWGIIQDYT